MTHPILPAREERVFPLEDLEVRADEGKPPRIVGLAPRYGVWSDDLGGFVERFEPGAFTKTLQESDVRALFNHDANYVLGRTKAGTLGLTDQRQGLHFEVEPPTTTWAADLLVSMGRKDIDQTSFSFRAIKDEWTEPEKDGQPYRRVVREAKLYDVSIVTFPAYPSATAQVRSAMAAAGFDIDALSDCICRATRGLPPSDADVELLNRSTEVLRAFVPTEPEPEQGHHSADAAPRAGLAHSLCLLALAEADFPTNVKETP